MAPHLAFTKPAYIMALALGGRMPLRVGTVRATAQLGRCSRRGPRCARDLAGERQLLGGHTRCGRLWSDIWSYPDPVDSLYYAASWTELTSSNCAGVM
jgi:hypothetical protein